MVMARRRRHTCAHTVEELQAHWMCDCHYHNVVAFRCYGCGARPPRRVRAMLRSLLSEATRRPRRPGRVLARLARRAGRARAGRPTDA